MNTEIRKTPDNKHLIVEIILYASPQHPKLYDITVVMYSPLLGQMSKKLETCPMTAQKAVDTITGLHKSFDSDIGVSLLISDDLVEPLNKEMVTAAANSDYQNKAETSHPEALI